MLGGDPNIYYEPLSCRRYNYSPADDTHACRLVFLNSVLQDPSNNTLVRGGRFIWCKNFKYEGIGCDGMRHLSFTVDKGRKRFQVSESSVLCVPSKTYINNNRYFMRKEKTFIGFSSVFSYANVLDLMTLNTSESKEELLERIHNDRPYKAGVLVAPRLGYFYPASFDQQDVLLEHPYGLVLGPSLSNDEDFGREFYRVRFAGTTYERVHPVEMEIIKNEV